VLPSASATARGLAASFAPQELGPAVARSAAIVRRPSRFRLALRVRGLAPGVYRLDLRAAEGRSSVGRLRISRQVVVR
jgi:hypothetical protein